MESKELEVITDKLEVLNIKKDLGQFYTTNHSYILQDIRIPPDVLIIEPFAGEGDLVDYINILPFLTILLLCIL